MPINAASEKKIRSSALRELQDDFTQIQILNRDLVVTTDKSKELDAKFIAKSAGEIHKRAERLLGNLALPENAMGSPATAAQLATGPIAVRKAIVNLGWLIYNFTKNPMFKEAQVIDAASAEKARRDLDDILSLSARLKLVAEKMNDLK